MLKTVKDACALHASTLDYQVVGGIASLAKVIDARDQGRTFFEKNYLTPDMEGAAAGGAARRHSDARGVSCRALGEHRALGV